MHKIAVEINREEFTFSKRRYGSHAVWSILLTDKERLGKALNLELKTELDLKNKALPEINLSKEFAVSGLSLSRLYVGDVRRLFKKLNDILKIDAAKIDVAEITVKIQGEEFTFSRRRYGPHIAWAALLSDKERLGKSLNVELKTVLPELTPSKEFAVSSPGLYQLYIGDAADQVKNLKDIINVDARKTNVNETEVEIHGEKFAFSRRRNGVHIVWSLLLSDKERLAKAMGWDLKRSKTNTGFSDLADLIDDLG